MTTTSLSINLSLSPPPFSSAAAVATTTSFYEAPSSLRFPHFRSSTSNPRSLFCEISRFRCLEGLERNRGSGIFSVKANKMTIAEVRPEDGEEDCPPLLDPETNSKPRRIALFVEPSPFAWVFLCLINLWFLVLGFCWPCVFVAHLLFYGFHITFKFKLLGIEYLAYLMILLQLLFLFPHCTLCLTRLSCI